jgi:hypothetical protein
VVEERHVRVIHLSHDLELRAIARSIFQEFIISETDQSSKSPQKQQPIDFLAKFAKIRSGKGFMDIDSPFLLPEQLWDTGKTLLDAPEDFAPDTAAKLALYEATLSRYRLDSGQEPATTREIAAVIGMQFLGDKLAEPANLEALLHTPDLAADLQNLVAEAYPDSMRGMLVTTR